jgi:hypothetical protein
MMPCNTKCRSPKNTQAILTVPAQSSLITSNPYI